MITFWVAITVKATVLLSIALALNAFLAKRGSAALRHIVWTSAMLTVLLLPAASSLHPAWIHSAKAVPSIGVARLIPASAALSQSVSPREIPANPAPIARWIVLIWAAGAIFVFSGTAAGLIRIARITRRANPAKAGPVRLCWSREISAPLTWGLFRPVILMPAASANWSRNWLRFAEDHELAHIARKDWLSQMLARLACALYWFHPLAWFTAARMRREAERACDDAVLATGTEATQYASCLLEIARAWSLGPAIATGTLAMARPSDLEPRLRSILDPGANRRPAKRAGIVAAAVTAIAFLFVLGPARSLAQNSSTGLFGSVYDPSGAAIPHALVTAKSASSDREELATTDDAGAYSFRGLVSGVYDIEVKKPGFAILHRADVSVDASQSQHLDLTLQVGPVLESMDVTGIAPEPPVPVTGKTPQRIRVGGDVQATRITAKVAPVYPAAALAQGIEGSVLLRAVIGTGGNLLSITPLNTLVDPSLTAAAIDAVQQWRYRPTLLNGVPVEVVTTITINFRLAKRFTAQAEPASRR